MLDQCIPKQNLLFLLSSLGQRFLLFFEPMEKYKYIDVCQKSIEKGSYRLKIDKFQNIWIGAVPVHWKRIISWVGTLVNINHKIKNKSFLQRLTFSSLYINTNVTKMKPKNRDKLTARHNRKLMTFLVDKFLIRLHSCDPSFLFYSWAVQNSQLYQKFQPVDYELNNMNPSRQ